MRRFYARFTRGGAALAILSTIVATMVAAIERAPNARADAVPAAGVAATVTADPMPTVQVNGIVWAQVTVGDIVYVVTAADLAHGSVKDTATATGADPAGTTITVPSNPVTVPVTQLPNLAIVKSASTSSVSAAGQVVTYTFKVTNTGNVQLTNVGVRDIQTAPAGAATTPVCKMLTSPAGICSGTFTTLAPGQVATFTATYTVTAADLAQGVIKDTATTTGTSPAGTPITVPSNSVTITAKKSQYPSY